MGDAEKTTLLGAAPAAYGYDGGGYDADGGWAGDEDADRQRRRRRLLVIGGAVALLVVVGAVLAAVLLNHGSNAPVAAATQVAVPSVVNQDQATATQSLQSAGLTVGTVTQVTSTAQQKGLVVSTSPAGGAQVAKGSAVNLSIGSGPDAITVPDVTGKTASAASAALKQAGFTGNINTEQQDSLTAKGRVVQSDPAAGSQAAPGSTITLSVSTGTVPMPDVRGKTEAQARQALVAAGFDAGQINSTTVERDDVPQGRVAGTDPAPGTPVGPGETVNLQIAQPTPPQRSTSPSSSPSSTPTPTATPSATTTPGA
jgi:serine/threonine-protein kinase